MLTVCTGSTELRPCRLMLPTPVYDPNDPLEAMLDFIWDKMLALKQARLQALHPPRPPDSQPESSNASGESSNGEGPSQPASAEGSNGNRAAEPPAPAWPALAAIHGYPPSPSYDPFASMSTTTNGNGPPTRGYYISSRDAYPELWERIGWSNFS